MVECGSLENCYTRKRIGSSNLPLSEVLILFIPALFFTFLSLAHAEIVLLKNGKAIETKILKEDESFVLVEVAGGQVKIPRADIQTIWRGSEEELLEVRGKQVHFVKGVELYKEGQFKEAAEQFGQALGPGAANAIIYANLGSTYASLGEAQKAETHFLKALEQKPNDPHTLLNLARLYETQKDFKRAITYYQRSETLQPDDSNIKRGLANSFFMTGDFKSALAVYDALEPLHDIPTLNNKAATYIQTGNLEAAEEILKKIIDADTRFDPPFLNLAEISKQRKKYKDAEFQYNIVLSRNPQNARAQIGLAQVKSEQKDFDQAKTLLENVLKSEPDNFDARYALAQLASQQEAWDDAISQYNEIFKNSPTSLWALNQAGLLYIKKNEPQQALKTFKKLLDINNRYAKGHANAGLAYAFLGDVEKALKEWDLALELDPKLKEAAQNKKLLEEVMQRNRNEKTSVAP